MFRRKKKEKFTLPAGYEGSIYTGTDKNGVFYYKINLTYHGEDYVEEVQHLRYGVSGPYPLYTSREFKELEEACAALSIWARQDNNKKVAATLEPVTVGSSTEPTTFALHDVSKQTGEPT